MPHRGTSSIVKVECGSGQTGHHGFEAFPGFAAETIIAHLAGTPQGTIDVVALIFIVARILHGIAYIRDLSAFRSLVWTIGFGATIAMFVIAA